MPVGGLHAIAVGFPEKWHFAFDSDRCTVAEAWRGKFMDAETAWFDRFAQPVKPLGDKVIRFPSGPAIGLLDNKNSAWPSNAKSAKLGFGGYELDPSGVPTFRYEVAGYAVTDRIQPQVEQGNTIGFHLTLTARNISAPRSKAQLWFRALADKRLQRPASRPANVHASLLDNNGLTVGLLNKVPFGEVRNSAGNSEWLIPFKFEDNQFSTLEILYQWK